MRWTVLLILTLWGCRHHDEVQPVSPPINRVIQKPALHAQSKGVRDFAYIEEVAKTPDGYRFTLQYADFLRGEDARKAAVEDGEINPDEELENDCYIRPTDDDPVEFVLDPKAQILLAQSPPEASVPIALAEFAKRFSQGDPEENELASSGWWVTLDGDRILKLEQQWEP